ncbi:MAG: AbiV family abortive infection protein [Candidatus Electrothrix sp. EH2]|nr:AbiV family abortive infection protein [Candidatus Electrothrix sp. EH2]
MEIDLQSIGLETVQDALKKGALIFNKDTKIEEFNNACDHILVLLEDSFYCFERSSWGTSVFLSITAIEETAKAEVGLYRRDGQVEPVKRGKDKLFNHQKKHQMAVLPTCFIGKRLKDALGKKRCEELLHEAARGDFRNLRESSLYFNNENGRFVTPATEVGEARAKELLLLALVVVDDRLVGYTNHTGVIEQRINEMFRAICHS